MGDGSELILPSTRRTMVGRGEEAGARERVWECGAGLESGKGVCVGGGTGLTDGEACEGARPSDRRAGQGKDADTRSD